MAEDRVTEANNKGQEDGARFRDASLTEYMLSQLVLSSWYDAPDDPEEKEAYEDGFRNAAGPSLWNIIMGR